MHSTYKKKLFLYFFLVFAAFTVIIVMAQRSREKEYKTENLRNSLHIYTEMIDGFLKDHPIDSLPSIISWLPGNIRTTLVNEEGEVLFDNSVEKERKLENHLDRPEIASAKLHGNGSAIRLSGTTGMDYYYYARYRYPYFIRVAMPYNIVLKDYMTIDYMFIYFILLLFFTVLILLLYISDKFGKAISGLNTFISAASHGNINTRDIKFPDTELGEIGQQIVSNFHLLEENKNQLKQEQEKLLRHLHYSEEGLCIFSPEYKKTYANSLFIQYINTILDEPLLDPDQLFDKPEFSEIKSFLAEQIPVTHPDKTPVFQDKILKNGKHFSVRLIIFNDNSFEISLNNVSDKEKNRLLKQEMTNNIAHELKTPVSSIRGYIETLLEQDNIPADKQRFFLERTYMQALRLSDLIRDVALITKTEEASTFFEKEKVNIRNLIEEVTKELKNAITGNNIFIENRIAEKINIKGNYTLLYSIFRNLIENAVHYGGENIQIVIDKYAEDPDYYYFDLYDTGPGVSEEHLERIFERFYRVNEGRSRTSGGSGLGLAIVKNAVFFHKGQISAKNRKEGGLEFVFTLKK